MPLKQREKTVLNKNCRKRLQISNSLYSGKEKLLREHIEGACNAEGCEETDGIKVFLELVFYQKVLDVSAHVINTHSFLKLAFHYLKVVAFLNIYQ